MERPIVMAEHPEYKLIDISAELAERWYNCIDRELYDKMSAEDKARYQEVRALYLRVLLCRLRSIAAHRDHFVWRLYVRLCLHASVR